MPAVMTSHVLKSATETMQFCTNCGQSVVGMKFCASCGTATALPNDTQTSVSAQGVAFVTGEAVTPGVTAPNSEVMTRVNKNNLKKAKEASDEAKANFKKSNPNATDATINLFLQFKQEQHQQQQKQSQKQKLFEQQQATFQPEDLHGCYCSKSHPAYLGCSCICKCCDEGGCCSFCCPMGEAVGKLVLCECGCYSCCCLPCCVPVMCLTRNHRYQRTEENAAPDALFGSVSTPTDTYKTTLKSGYEDGRMTEAHDWLRFLSRNEYHATQTASYGLTFDECLPVGDGYRIYRRCCPVGELTGAHAQALSMDRA